MGKVTSKDVAQLAGVSQTTVSFVLNKRSSASISPETTEKVLRAAKALGYAIPRREHKKHPITLGLMVPTLSNMYYPFLLQHIEIEAKARGIHVIILNILRDSKNEAAYFEYLRNGTVDGILALFMPQTDIPKELPVVIVSENQPGTLTDTLSLNSYQAGYMLADHLLKLGHRDIAYISSPLSNITSARKYRLEGIHACFSEVGLEHRIQVLAETAEQEIHDTAYEYDCGYSLTKRLLAQHTSATAIVAVNDTTAAGCISALQEAGLRIPQDMAVAGFDNLLIAKILQLTSVDQMASHACRVALDMLIEKITRPHASVLPIKMEYMPQLIVRASTQSGT